MTDALTPGPTPAQNDTAYSTAVIVYVLYFIGFFTGLTALAGVIIAHMKSGEVSPDVQTHFTYQIRTFWFGVLMLVVGGILSFILVGWLLIAWWFVWTLIRCIKGFLAAHERRPLADSATLMW